MKQLKPIHVLAFLIGVFLLLAPLVWFAPVDGYPLGWFRLRFLTASDFLKPAEQESKDISKLIASVDTSMVEVEPLLQHANASDGSMGAPIGGVMKDSSATTIMLTDSGRDNLAKVFEKLDKLAQSKGKLHIFHYGDSQIEGDRMTAFIRQRLQNQFGGNGPGMIPATNVYSTMTFKQRYSENFKRYMCFGLKDTRLKSRKYGAMGTSSRFTPEFYDAARDTIEQVAWIEIEPGRGGYTRSREYNNVAMHYTSCTMPCKVEVYQNGSLIHEDSLQMDGAPHDLKLSFKSTPGKLKYIFKSKYSPTINGFSLEGDYGVQVSNVAMRGCSGTIFGYIDQAQLAQDYSEKNVELFILQFGGNAIPYMKDSVAVRNFARHLKGQLQTIRRLRPTAAIILIGPSDMSTLKNGVFVTYPMLPYCVEQLKKISMETGNGYWDLYAAMGGENSMPAWVSQGLAGKDFIHFSPKGASIASELFYEALSAEYMKWKNGAY